MQFVRFESRARSLRNGATVRPVRAGPTCRDGAYEMQGKLALAAPGTRTGVPASHHDQVAHRPKQSSRTAAVVRNVKNPSCRGRRPALIGAIAPRYGIESARKQTRDSRRSESAPVQSPRKAARGIAASGPMGTGGNLREARSCPAEGFATGARLRSVHRGVSTNRPGRAPDARPGRRVPFGQTSAPVHSPGRDGDVHQSITAHCTTHTTARGQLFTVVCPTTYIGDPAVRAMPRLVPPVAPFGGGSVT